ncbi:unnamed protein product [Haemonchus placei]|uniref:CUB_2 domain-containing protein n=1 Tax=Haemonchus placei TaxID=6290 RepID=A0A0N4WCS3_HAEPC|nr:unnamed protein product [Haemonchus placei]
MILLIFLLISAATSCKLRARVFSTTTNPVFAQFTFYNGTKSQVYHFERMQQSYGLTLQSPICDLKPTILKSYKNWPVPGVKPIGQTQAFIEGPKMIILFLLLISAVSTCKLKARVFSASFHPVWAQFTFFNETKSEMYEFTTNNQNHTLYIVGKDCNMKPTILKSYNEPPYDGLAPIGQTSAFIEGQGMLDYTVISDFSGSVMFVLILISISLVSSCKLKVKVDAETYHPVWAQFTFHNETKSKVYKFTDGHQNHTLYIEGLICNLKPTILKSYKQSPKPGVKPIGQTAAFVEGHGMIGYTVWTGLLNFTSSF